MTKLNGTVECGGSGGEVEWLEVHFGGVLGR